MRRSIIVFFIMVLLATGLAYAQDTTKAADRNTWYVAGLFNAQYFLPYNEGNYVENGFLTLNINPRVLCFPIKGLGVGVDTDFYYFTGHFTDMEFEIGPRVAYYLRKPGTLNQLMPYVGCSFNYLLNDLDPGAIETGWNLKLGLGISPVFGRHVSVPFEFGYMYHNLSSNFGSSSFSNTTSRIYIDIGIGAFLWRKKTETNK